MLSKDNVYGKVQCRLTIMTYLNKIIRNPFGFFFLIFCPFVVVIFLEVADTIVEFRSEREKKSED